MLPKHVPKPIHNLLQLAQPQLSRPARTIFKILLQNIKPLVNLLMLSQQLELLPERWHFLSEHGENVLLLDGVVHGEVVAEVETDSEELFDGHVFGAFL